MLTRTVKFPVSFIANAASGNVEGHRATFVHRVLALVRGSKHVMGNPLVLPQTWPWLSLLRRQQLETHEWIQTVHKNCRRKTAVEIYIKDTEFWFNMRYKHTTILHVHTSAWDRCSLLTVYFLSLIFDSKCSSPFHSLKDSITHNTTIGSYHSRNTTWYLLIKW